MTYMLTTTVPRITAAKLDSLKRLAGNLAPFVVAPLIETEAEAVTQATTTVNAELAKDSQYASITGVEKVTFDFEADEWAITFQIFD